MKKDSKTDWTRLSSMTDEQINTDDIVELDHTFFRNAQLKTPSKQPVTLRIDADVLAFFKAEGPGYQTRINQLLRKYMDAQQSH
jgi:uncharacterized protein (DUF4415 family)